MICEEEEDLLSRELILSEFWAGEGYNSIQYDIMPAVHVTGLTATQNSPFLP